MPSNADATRLPAGTRRKWFEAEATDPARAHHALALIQRLYIIERDGAEMNAPARQEARRLHALPILQEFKIWLDGEQEKLLPKSPAGQAAQYARNQWEALTRYCKEGDLAIDNNAAERMMKPCAIGRKNSYDRKSRVCAQEHARISTIL